MMEIVRLIGSLGTGVALMYLFDPLAGRRRRALARDKVTRVVNDAAEAVDKTSRDLRNRWSGLMLELRQLYAEEEPTDEVLAERVRAKLGFLVGHPGSIEVRAEQGRVALSGTILKDEHRYLLRRVAAVRGVKRVEDRLVTQDKAASTPELQGEPGQRKRGDRPDLMQSHWAPATRFLVGTFAGGLLLYGARLRSLPGAALASVGAGMLARALSNLEFKRLTGVGAREEAVEIQKTVTIAAPVERVFSFWTDYQNFPSFMSNVREVGDLGQDRYHWVVAGPGGVPVEWDATVTSHVPNEEVGWKTVPGSPVQHAGLVRFESLPEGGTRLTVRMSYNPVAGGLGHALAALFYADPKTQMDQDLMRMKSLIETGKPPGDAARAKETEGSLH